MYTILSCELKNIFYLCTHKKRRGCGEMVDTLVSGASASRRVGSTPIIRTIKRKNFRILPLISYIYGTNF